MLMKLELGQPERVVKWHTERRDRKEQRKKGTIPVLILLDEEVIEGIYFHANILSIFSASVCCWLLVSRPLHRL